jgi:hypothetical protein
MAGRQFRLLLGVALASTLTVSSPLPAVACVGDGCINIYSTAPGAGALATTWDFAARKIQTFEVFCEAGLCLYSSIDPGFLPGFEAVGDDYFPLAAGTRVSFAVVAKDAAITVRLGGNRIEPGASELIGTTPDLHNHPSWQLLLPAGEEGDYPLEFRFTTDSPTYADSQTFTAVLTNLPPRTPTADASPTPTPTTDPDPSCPGDCNGDGNVSIAELVRGVVGALGGAGCEAFDRNGDGTIAVNELIVAVNAALHGCPIAATPTATRPATLWTIQETIFSPRCAIATCHDTTTRSGDLVLEAGASHGELVGVEPDVDTARDAGLLRVDPGDPDNSFLVIKLEGPTPSQGSRMPLTGPLLDPADIGIIRAWIAAGAAP